MESVRLAKARENNAKASTAKDKGKGKQGQQGQQGQEKSKDKDKNEDSIECWNCGKCGHYSKDGHQQRWFERKTQIQECNGCSQS